MPLVKPYSFSVVSDWYRNLDQEENYSGRPRYFPRKPSRGSSRRKQAGAMRRLACSAQCWRTLTSECTDL
ncbi:hypothetical protein J6590_022476 [Homalodisca vitripennis]|nr:hypothetical protein J6590_022476 [Homalodisca vitripennis]